MIINTLVFFKFVCIGFLFFGDTVINSKKIHEYILFNTHELTILLFGIDELTWLLYNTHEFHTIS